MIDFLKNLFGIKTLKGQVMSVINRKIKLAEIELNAEIRSAKKRKDEAKSRKSAELNAFLQSHLESLKAINHKHKVDVSESTEKVVNRLLEKVI